jgi:hypothetical protein
MRNSLLVIGLLVLPITASATPATNGIFVNTETLNGIFVNTGVINGIFVNGRNMSNGYVTAAALGDETIGGVRPSWQAYKPDHYLYYPHVEGTGLAGWAWEWAVGGWVWRSGAWFQGTVMPAGVYDRTTGTTEIATIRIADIWSYPGVNMLLHTVEVQGFDASNTEHWEPLCGRDAYQQPIPAIMLRGEWSLAEWSSIGGDQISDSPYRVTFACATGALGKCAADCTDKPLCKLLGVPNALGYKRWAPPEQVLVDGTWVWRDYALDHQACTRMVRADYCGDGRTWTATGTPIDVYDRTRLNTAEKASSWYWMYEATWNADGAVRISCDRLYEGPVTCPSGGSAPWALALTTTSYACYTDDGMTNPSARLGNLRQKTIALPLPTTPFHF